MRITKHVLSCLLFSLCLASPTLGAPGDIPTVIDHFVADRFPDARSHVWVVNNAEWGSQDEVVVDLNTLVVPREGQAPTETRFLLLIVRGKLAATQSIPLGAKIECTPDEVL